jgi:4'-phosphopantetheinyl transferase
MAGSEQSAAGPAPEGDLTTTRERAVPAPRAPSPAPPVHVPAAPAPAAPALAGRAPAAPVGVACHVWWAVPADLSGRHHLLSPVERGRLETLMRPVDRERQAGGAALLRLAVAELTGVAAADVVVARSCPDCDRPHGRPTLPDLPLHASISHSADRVVVAVTAAGPIGVDVELVAPLRTEGLAASVLGDGEHSAGEADFYRYWTRKESVVKATGDGLRAALAKVRVSGPHEPPRLLGYPGPTPLTASMADLDPGPGYLGALTVLHPGPLTVTEHWYGAAPGA